MYYLGFTEILFTQCNVYLHYLLFRNSVRYGSVENIRLYKQMNSIPWLKAVSYTYLKLSLFETKMVKITNQ